MKNLLTKIKAENLNNMHINMIVPIIVEWLTPFLGKKITTVNNTLIAKVAKDQPIFTLEHFQYYLEISYNSIYMRGKTWMNYPESEGCHYTYSNRYIGRLENQILIELEENPEPLRTDYDIDEIEQTRSTISALKSQIRKLEGEIHPFATDIY